MFWNPWIYSLLVSCMLLIRLCIFEPVTLPLPLPFGDVDIFEVFSFFFSFLMVFLWDGWGCLCGQVC